MCSGDLDPEYGSGPLRTLSRHWRRRRATPLQGLVQAWMRSVRRIASAERPTRRLQHGRSKDGQGCGGLSGPRRHRYRQGHPPCRLAGGAFDPLGRAGVDRSLPDRALQGFGAARLRGRPGRCKSDVPDCRRRQQPAGLGLLKRPHRPREDAGARHMQKALAQMNPELDSALGDIGGKTGMRIIRAIVAGERDRRAFGAELAAVPSIGTEAMLAILSEAGPDFSMLPSESRFCQRLGLAPGTGISGGKRLGGTQIAGQSLRVCAMCLRRDQSSLGGSSRSASCSARPSGRGSKRRTRMATSSDWNRRLRGPEGLAGEF